MLAAGALIWTSNAGAQSEVVDAVIEEQKELEQIARNSQIRIAQLDDETTQLLGEYRQVVSEADNLETYNEQLAAQVSSQQEEIDSVLSQLEQIERTSQEVMPMMRRMLKDYIQAEPDLEVCGTAASGSEALEALSDGTADLVVVDMSLPKMSGIDLVEVLLARQPALRCLMYSGHSEPSYVKRARAAGARGYVLKGGPDELPKAIRQVLGGEEYLSEPLRRYFGL